MFRFIFLQLLFYFIFFILLHMKPHLNKNMKQMQHDYWLRTETVNNVVVFSAMFLSETLSISSTVTSRDIRPLLSTAVPHARQPRYSAVDIRGSSHVQ